MRIRHGLLLALALIAIICAGCTTKESKENTIFGGSNPLLRHLEIGGVPVKAGHTINVPLGHVQTIRFELSKAVTPASVDNTLIFSLRIENVDEGTTSVLTQSLLDQNGELFWTDATNQRIEYRMSHDMSFINVGTVRVPLGALGDKFRVHVDFFVVNAADGKEFAITGDEFFVVWTASASGPIEP